MEQPHNVLDEARRQALAVRALYETLEDRINGRTWSLHDGEVALRIAFEREVVGGAGSVRKVRTSSVIMRSIHTTTHAA